MIDRFEKLIKGSVTLEANSFNQITAMEWNGDKFVNANEHLTEHGGNFKNPTNDPLIDR